MSDRHYVHHHDEVQLAKILKESKPWLEKYGTAIIYAVAAVMAIAAVAVYFLRQPPATAEASHGLLVATTPEDFQGVADESPDSPIGVVAKVRQGELSLQDAISKMFTDRESGNEILSQSEVTFERLSERKDLSPDVRLRVLVGLARIAETRCDGSEESASAAVAAWDKVLKEFPDSKVFKELAEDRVRKLPLDATRSFYAWFQKQDPKPGDDLLLPQDGPGKVPDIPKIDIPDFTAPGLPGQSESAPEGDAKPADGSDPTTPTPESPATPEGDKPAPPGEEKPGVPESSPATPDEKPAPGEDKPAPPDEEPAPADEKPVPSEGTPDPAPEKSGE